MRILICLISALVLGGCANMSSNPKCEGLTVEQCKYKLKWDSKIRYLNENTEIYEAKIDLIDDTYTPQMVVDIYGKMAAPVAGCRVSESMSAYGSTTFLHCSDTRSKKTYYFKNHKLISISTR